MERQRSWIVTTGFLYSLMAVGYAWAGIMLPFVLVAYFRLPEMTGTLELINYIALLIMCVAVSVYSSIIVIRMMLRVQPIRTFDRRGIPRKTFDYSIDCVIIMAFPVSTYRAVFIDIFYDVRNIWTVFEMNHIVLVETLRILTIVAPIFLASIISIVSCVSYSIIWKRLCHGDFILFLRRFSSQGDFLPIVPILTSPMKGVRIVMLVEQAIWRLGSLDRRLGGNWDPFVVSFVGINLRRPIESIPILIESNESEWEDTIKSLITRSSCVLMDVSEYSPSLSIELSELRTIDNDNKTIYIKSNHQEGAPASSNTLYNNANERAIAYGPSWQANYAIILINISIWLVCTLGLTFAIFQIHETYEKHSIAWVSPLVDTMIVVLTLFPWIIIPALLQVVMAAPISEDAYRSIRNAIRGACKRSGGFRPL